MVRNNVSENIIAAKLRSERGASITFALLLFLVCAAMSAVILVAATTASGRMAGIAETDQRYYSVTSAAEVISSIVDGKTVTKVVIDHGDPKYFAKAAGSITEEDLSESVSTPPDVDTEAESLVEDIKSEPVHGSIVTGQGDTFLFRLADLAIGNTDECEWTISSTGNTAELNADPLAVTAKPGFKEDGNLYLDVSNRSGSPYNNDRFSPYTLRIEFNTDVDRNPSVSIDKNKKTEIEVTQVSFSLFTIQSPYDDK